MNHLLVHPREENPPGEVHLLLRQDRLLVPHVEILRERLLDRLAVVALVQVEARRRREGRVRAENTRPAELSPINQYVSNSDVLIPFLVGIRIGHGITVF